MRVALLTELRFLSYRRISPPKMAEVLRSMARSRVRRAKLLVVAEGL